jgi:hypothetical protein
MPVRALMPPGQPRAERRCCGFPLLRLRSWISQGGSDRPLESSDHVSGLDHGQWRLSTLSSTAMAAPLVGRQVEISGLASRPELNQRVGTAQSFNEDTGRALCTV